MPRRNRVDPWGDLHAVSARGVGGLLLPHLRLDLGHERSPPGGPVGARDQDTAEDLENLASLLGQFHERSFRESPRRALPSPGPTANARPLRLTMDVIAAPPAPSTRLPASRLFPCPSMPLARITCSNPSGERGVRGAGDGGYLRARSWAATVLRLAAPICSVLGDLAGSSRGSRRSLAPWGRPARLAPVREWV